MTTIEQPRVAVVTGASAGVGRATAVRLAARGFDVGLLARGEGGLAGAAADVHAHGRRSLAVPVDVANWQEVRAAAHEIEATLGPVDVWINNAMTTVFAPVRAVEPEELRRATEVTYLGQVHGALAALELMRPRDRGGIVSVGSALAFRAIPLQAAYCGAKFAVRGFMSSLRTELIHEGSGIRVSMVHLPAVNTPQFGWCRSRLPDQPQPVPPIYSPYKVADVIVDVAMDGRRQRVIGAWNRLIIQGEKFMPGVLDHYAARTGWSSQQVSGEHVGERDGNLQKPLDDAPDADHGAEGRFAHRAHGVIDPAFLRSLPSIGADLAQAIADRRRERRARRR